MKTFNFETSTHGKEKTAWLKENYKNSISQQEFVDTMQNEFRKFAKGHYKAHRYAPAHLKKEYQHLVKDFGFFQP